MTENFLDKAMANLTVRDDKIYHCGVCQRPYKNEGSCRNHIEATHQKELETTALILKEDEMKQYSVYHMNENPWLDRPLARLLSQDFESNYTLVALVSTDKGLDDVYQVTNHIDNEWWENPEVDWHKESRSTSINDLIVLAEGKCWRVARIGFEEVKII